MRPKNEQALPFRWIALILRLPPKSVIIDLPLSYTLLFIKSKQCKASRIIMLPLSYTKPASYLLIGFLLLDFLLSSFARSFSI